VLYSGGGQYDNTIRVWDTAKRECIATLTGHTDSVLSLALSGDGSVLYSGSGGWQNDNTIRVWSTG
jgi:WD40 repeat protein